MRHAKNSRESRKAQVVLVRVVTPDVSEKMEKIEEEETCRLIEDAGGEVKKVVRQKRSHPHPTWYVGKGKLKEVERALEETQAEVVLFDTSLTPSQMTHLQEYLPVKVLDRIHLILDIFSRRAHSREGKLQVELAQLTYMLPRLTGKGRELSRLGGGIGTRGPGEPYLEVKQREIRRRIRHIKGELERIQQHYQTQRRLRFEHHVPQIALIGYTNAGKSTLFNRLTQEHVPAQDQTFTTLEPVTRRLVLEGIGEVVISDTVGFIRKLPPWLIEAFRTTLMEVYSAQLLLHVLDASSVALDDERRTVETILKRMELDTLSRLEVLNKIDRIGNDERQHLQLLFPNAVFVSARTGEGMSELVERIVYELRKGQQQIHIFLPYTQLGKRDLIFKHGSLEKEKHLREGVEIIARVPEWLSTLFAPYSMKSHKTGDEIDKEPSDVVS